MWVTSRGIWNVLIENTRNRRWHWDASPSPIKSLYGRRTFVRWRHNQIFSAYGLPIFLTSDASLARCAYWSSTKIPRFDCYLQLLNTQWLLLCQKNPHYICNAEFQRQSTFSICNVSYRKVVQSRNVSVNPTGICKQLKEQYHYSDSSKNRRLVHICFRKKLYHEIGGLEIKVST